MESCSYNMEQNGKLSLKEKINCIRINVDSFFL